jgi:Tfp pilus assembly protein PilX
MRNRNANLLIPAKQKGAVLIVGLVMLAVMTLLVVSMLKTSVLELKIGGVHQVAAMNFANAERGITKFMNDNQGNFAAGFITTAVGEAAVNTPPTVDGGTVAITPTEIGCLRGGAASGSAMAGVAGATPTGTLDEIYYDINSTATGTITGGSSSVHQGVYTTGPAGACP